MNKKFIYIWLLLFGILENTFAQRIFVSHYYILKRFNDYDANYEDENSFKFYVNGENILYSGTKKYCKQVVNQCLNIPGFDFCVCKNGLPGNLSPNTDNCFKAQTDAFFIGPYYNFMDNLLHVLWHTEHILLLIFGS